MRLLVTGGAGFIGSNFIRYMLSKCREIEILNLDSLSSSGRLENVSDMRKDKRHKFIHGNIQDRKTVEGIMRKGTDVLVNFAAESHVDRSIKEAGPFVLTDVYGTYVLMEAARKYDVKKIVQISTDEVYGSIRKGSFDESAQLNPSSPYAASKASGDLIAQSFYKTYNLNITITRSSNNYGPYQYPEKLIPKLILRALRNLPLPLYGTGKQTRDWIYVFDNCEALHLIVEKGKPGEIYNIAAGNEYSNLEIARLILKITERPEKLTRFVADRPGHDWRYSLNTTKIGQLKWRPRNAFDKSLRETVKWYEKNKWWWSPLLEDDFVSRDTPWL